MTPRLNGQRAVREDRLGIKYDDSTRDKIQEIIKKEWRRLEGEVPDCDTFIQHIFTTLKKAGFRSPSGHPLSERTVRFQVKRAGIRFRNRRSSSAPTTTPAVGIAPLAGPPPMLRLILENESIGPVAQIQMIKAFFGMK